MTIILTSVLSTVSCISLAATSMWFAFELWIYHKHEGRRWLSDIFSEHKKYLSDTFGWNGKLFRLARPVLGPGRKVARSLTHTGLSALESEKHETNIGIPRPRLTVTGNISKDKKVSWYLDVDEKLMTDSERSRHLWAEAYRRVIQDLFQRDPTSRTRSWRTLPAAVRDNAIISKLARMSISEHLKVSERHDATVRFLQFSPDGNLLATSRCVCVSNYAKGIQ